MRLVFYYDGLSLRAMRCRISWYVINVTVYALYVAICTCCTANERVVNWHDGIGL